MSPEQIEVERKAFEAKHQRFDLSGDIGDWTKRWRYDSPIIDAMWEGWLARAEKAQRVRAHLQFAVDILSRIPALGSSAQVEAMRAALKD